MAKEIRVRVLGGELQQLLTLRDMSIYGYTDSEIIRTLLEREVAKLRVNPMGRIAALAHEIELLADSAAQAAESRTE